MLLHDDERHMRHRKLLLPAFHGDAVERYAGELAEVARREISGWPVGKPFKTHHPMQEIALEVILRAVFGARDEAALEELRGALMPFLRDSWALFTPIPMRRSANPVWRRYMGQRRRARDLVKAQIANARKEDSGDHILATMLRYRDDDDQPIRDVEILDQAMSLLFAGHDTTAASLAFAAERLARNPDAQERLAEQLAAGDREYLDAVIKETLRVRPVLPFGPRTVVEETELAGHLIPAGTTVQTNAVILHRLPELWDEPDEFRPERWLDGAKQTPYSWLPFGGGVHRCLGASFSQVEMRVVLAELIGRYRLRPGTRQKESMRAHHTTLIPSAGGKVVLEPR